MSTKRTSEPKVVLVVDDMPVIRDPIAASLQAAGYATVTAGGGEEALGVLRSRRIDLVLLDVLMPGMDGLTVLRHMRADAKTASMPVVLLTAADGRRDVLEAATYGVSDYVLKSHFSLKELLNRVAKHVGPDGGTSPARPTSAAGNPKGTAATPARTSAAATIAPGALGRQAVSMRPLLTRESCIRRAEDALQGKTLSGVVSQVIGVAASPRSDLSQLATLVGRDPVLAARVLRAANSASVSSGRGMVANVTDAIRQIGSSAVRNIAATVGIFDVMPAAGPDAFNPVRCWQHSFAVAKLCERLAGGDATADGSAYLVGLCHDLSDILLQSQFSEEYRQVAETVAHLGCSREEAERTMLGITHAELSATVLRCVGLPEAVRVPIETFHASRGVPSRGAHPLARILYLADRYANGLLLASGGESPVGPLYGADCLDIAGDANPAVPDADTFRAEVFSLTAALGGLPPSEEARVLVTAYAKRDVRLFLARPSIFSAFDPVAAALGSLANVTVGTAPPAAETVANFKGIVLLSPHDDETTPHAPPDPHRGRTAAGTPAILSLLASEPKAASTHQHAVGDTPAASSLISISQLAKFVASIC